MCCVALGGGQLPATPNASASIQTSNRPSTTHIPGRSIQQISQASTHLSVSSKGAGVGEQLLDGVLHHRAEIRSKRRGAGRVGWRVARRVGGQLAGKHADITGCL